MSFTLRTLYSILGKQDAKQGSMHLVTTDSAGKHWLDCRAVVPASTSTLHLPSTEMDNTTAESYRGHNEITNYLATSTA